MTSPIVLPGWGQSLGNAASALGNVPDILNPNRQFQLQFQQALSDPKLAQQYANMYSTNPNIFDPKRYGANNIAHLASIAPEQGYTQSQTEQKDIASRYQSDPTFKSNIQATQTKTPTQGEQALQGAETAKYTGENTINQNMIDAVKLLPLPDQQKFYKSAASAKLTGMNSDQLAEADLHLKNAQEQDQLGNEGEQYIKDHPDALKNVSQLAADIRTGKVPGDVAAGLQNSKYGVVINPALQLYDHQQDQQHQLDMQMNAEDSRDSRAQNKATSQEKIANDRLEAAKNAKSQNLASQFTKNFTAIKNGRKGFSAEDIPVLQNQLNEAFAAKDMADQTPILSLHSPWIGTNTVQFTSPSSKGETKTINSFNQVLPPAASASPSGTSGTKNHYKGAGVPSQLDTDLESGKINQQQYDQTIALGKSQGKIK